MSLKKTPSKSGKFIALGIIIAIFAGLYLFDFALSKTYDIEILSITPSGKIIADGKSVVEIKIRLTRGNSAIAGHKIVAVPKDGGSLKNAKILTDQNGEATFQYTPYLSSDYVEAKPAKIEIYDDNNSIFISVPKRIEIILDLCDSESSDDNSTNNGMF